MDLLNQLYNLDLNNLENKQEINNNEKFLESELEIANNVNLDEKNIEIGKSQNNFLKDIFLGSINFAVDTGIRAALPNLIEDQVIDIKNSIIKNGFKNGMKTLVEKVKEFGASFLGIKSGNFNNLEEMDIAIKKGGILKSISKGLNYGIDVARKKGIITKDMSKLIKNLKTTTINTISNNIKNKMLEEVKKIEKIEKHQELWYKSFENKDISAMKKEIKIINNLKSEIVKFEKIMNNIEKINNIHKIITENNNFEYEGLDELLKNIA